MINEMINEDEKIKVAEMMIQYGGSFIKCIGGALYRADDFNTIKIKKTWKEEWNKYLEMARIVEQRKKTEE